MGVFSQDQNLSTPMQRLQHFRLTFIGWLAVQMAQSYLLCARLMVPSHTVNPLRSVEGMDLPDQTLAQASAMVEEVGWTREVLLRPSQRLKVPLVRRV